MAAEVTAAADRVYFPEVSGDYYVGKTQHFFNLTSPGFPVTPDGYNDTATYIVVTILFATEQEPTPATSSKCMDYDFARLIEEGWDVPTGELQKLWTAVQWQPPPLVNPQEELKFPTLIFSPGAGMPCSSSTLLTSVMVSQGYTVICIDHPGEAPYLHTQCSNGPAGVHGLPIKYDWADEQILYDVNERRRKGVDALLQLFPALVDEIGAPFNRSRYLHFGFSMGGSLGSDIVERHDSVLATTTACSLTRTSVTPRWMCESRFSCSEMTKGGRTLTLRGTGSRATRPVGGGISRCWGHIISTSRTWACGLSN